MTIARLLEAMVAYSERNIHNIDRLIRVRTYAKTIGEPEGRYPVHSGVHFLRGFNAYVPYVREK